MNFTEVGFEVPSCTLAEMQDDIRLMEVTGRVLLAISRLDRPGMPRTTALTFEVTNAAPPPAFRLIAYDGITLPNLGGKTAICIGQCVIKGKDSHVLAVR